MAALLGRKSKSGILLPSPEGQTAPGQERAVCASCLRSRLYDSFCEVLALHPDFPALGAQAGLGPFWESCFTTSFNP